MRSLLVCLTLYLFNSACDEVTKTCKSCHSAILSFSVCLTVYSKNKSTQQEDNGIYNNTMIVTKEFNIKYFRLFIHWIM